MTKAKIKRMNLNAFPKLLLERRTSKKKHAAAALGHKPLLVQAEKRIVPTRSKANKIIVKQYR